MSGRDWRATSEGWRPPSESRERAPNESGRAPSESETRCESERAE